MRPEKIQGNVFVANLPAGLTDEQLAELFDSYGMVLRAYLARDPATGQTRGHGLVQLAPDKAVEAAVTGVNGKLMDGRSIDVRRADPDMSLVPVTPHQARVERPRPPPRAAVIVERLPVRSRAVPSMPTRRLTLTGSGRSPAP
jgi:RNA recognition motif-containing protein